MGEGGRLNSQAGPRDRLHGARRRSRGRSKKKKEKKKNSLQGAGAAAACCCYERGVDIA